MGRQRIPTIQAAQVGGSERPDPLDQPGAPANLELPTAATCPTCPDPSPMKMRPFRTGLFLIILTLAGAPIPLVAQETKRPPLPKPDHADVRYGPHERNVFDLWLPRTPAPAPLVLFIHGGGFQQGDKRSLSAEALRAYLDAGWAVASLNYRLTSTAPAPAAYLDCARALQHLRHHARGWKIDPQRVASTGGSAGAGTSLWLAFHDDLADPASADPVARESTRLTCVVVTNGQSSYDPRFAEKIGLPRPNFERHSFFLKFYGITADAIDTPQAYARYEAMAPITYLTRDDPPALLVYNHPNTPTTPDSNLNLVVHHPRFGLALQREMRRLGIPAIVQHLAAPGGPRVQIPEPRAGEEMVSSVEFIRDHFARAVR